MNRFGLKRRGRPFGFTSVVILASAALAQDSVVERCREAATDVARIACLEEALTRPDNNSPAPEREAPPDAATAIEGAHKAPGSDANGPALDPPLDIGAEQVRARNRSRADLESAHGLRVVEYSIVPYRRLQIELENGQVWRQIEGDTQRIRVDLERNRTVDIEESTLGGYKLSLNEMERTIRVERIH